MNRAKAELRAEGREQGIRQGITQGIEEQRSLLKRQVKTKFGERTAAQLAPLLATVAPPRLADIGDRIVAVPTADELVSRVEAIGH